MRKSSSADASDMATGGDPRPSGLPDRLITQKEAAARLGVGVSYLRNSTCPKHRLPSAGTGNKPLVRYSWADVLAWATARRS